MDAATLVKAMPGLSLTRASQLVNGANAAMSIGQINTVKRCAMFLAQIGTESASLRYQQEIQPPPGAQYPPYIGRTFIQVTWRDNYSAFGKWCKAKNLLADANLFVNKPATLAADQWAWLGPVWYWTVARPNLNAMADAGDIVGCTRAINGGLNGLEDRTQRYHRCLSLGTAILPTTATPQPEDDMPTQLYLTASSKKPTKVPAGGKWTPVLWDGWSPKGISGGVGVILGKTTKLFSMSAWLYTTGLTPDDNIYFKVQTLATKDNKPLATFPYSEQRGTTGGSNFNYSQVGSVNPGTNLRLLVSATRECTVTQAWWRIFVW